MPILLHQSALQPLWFMARSTIVEYSQQEGFYWVPLSTERDWKLPTPTTRCPHVWNDGSEPQQRKVELRARNFREFCRKWWLLRHFWVLLHTVNLRHGTEGFTSPPKEGALRIFLPEKSDGFGRVWTHELGYQRPARSPLDHRSLSVILSSLRIYSVVYLTVQLPPIRYNISNWETWYCRASD